jgi:MinD-like ATPase involved in chromosome partitioning or flagellar assembly
MSKIISVHSFRGGTGKSNTTANIAALLAMDGARVGVVDTDIASPGIHVLFNLDESDMAHSLNDYLWGKCTIEEAAQDVTGHVGAEIKGQIFLIPSSIKAGEIARILREGYTHPGLNEETLLSIAISNALVIIMRPDQQDYQGTAVTVDVAKKLDVPKMLMLINKTPSSLDFDDVRSRVEQIYNAKVGAVLPHSDEMMTLASSGIFSIRFPDHIVTKGLRSLVDQLKD